MFRPIVNCLPWKVQGPWGLEQNKNKVIQKTSHTGRMICSTAWNYSISRVLTAGPPRVIGAVLP